jgi:hypothetical protein
MHTQHFRARGQQQRHLRRNDRVHLYIHVFMYIKIHTRTHIHTDTHIHTCIHSTFERVASNNVIFEEIVRKKRKLEEYATTSNSEPEQYNNNICPESESQSSNTITHTTHASQTQIPDNKSNPTAHSRNTTKQQHEIRPTPQNQASTNTHQSTDHPSSHSAHTSSRRPVKPNGPAPPRKESVHVRIDPRRRAKWWYQKASNRSVAGDAEKRTDSDCSQIERSEYSSETVFDSVSDAEKFRGTESLAARRRARAHHDEATMLVKHAEDTQHSDGEDDLERNSERDAEDSNNNNTSGQTNQNSDGDEIENFHYSDGDEYFDQGLSRGVHAHESDDHDPCLHCEGSATKRHKTLARTRVAQGGFGTGDIHIGASTPARCMHTEGTASVEDGPEATVTARRNTNAGHSDDASGLEACVQKDQSHVHADFECIHYVMHSDGISAATKTTSLPPSSSSPSSSSSSSASSSSSSSSSRVKYAAADSTPQPQTTVSSTPLPTAEEPPVTIQGVSLFPSTTTPYTRPSSHSLLSLTTSPVPSESTPVVLSTSDFPASAVDGTSMLSAKESPLLSLSATSLFSSATPGAATTHRATTNSKKGHANQRASITVSGTPAFPSSVERSPVLVSGTPLLALGRSLMNVSGTPSWTYTSSDHTTALLAAVNGTPDVVNMSSVSVSSAHVFSAGGSSDVDAAAVNRTPDVVNMSSVRVSSAHVFSAGGSSDVDAAAVNGTPKSSRRTSAVAALLRARLHKKTVSGTPDGDHETSSCVQTDSDLQATKMGVEACGEHETSSCVQTDADLQATKMGVEARGEHETSSCVQTCAMTDVDLQATKMGVEACGVHATAMSDADVQVAKAGVEVSGIHTSAVHDADSHTTKIRDEACGIHASAMRDADWQVAGAGLEVSGIHTSAVHDANLQATKCVEVVQGDLNLCCGCMYVCMHI